MTAGMRLLPVLAGLALALSACNDPDASSPSPAGDIITGSPTGLAAAADCGAGTPSPSTSRPGDGSAALVLALVPRTEPPSAERQDEIPPGRIAFTTDRDDNSEIYVMNSDGGGQTNLSRSPAREDEPDWSPDGQRVAFVSDRGETPQVYIMNADGSDPRQITSAPGGGLSPRWSPDGKSIAFTTSGSICVIDVAEGGTRLVMEAQPEATAEPCRAGAFPGGWSPDSKRITYYSASVSRSIGQVCTINADGSGLEVEFADPPTYHVEPSWSPDGRRIVFRSIRDDNSEVWLLDLESGDDRNLTDDPATDIEPDWSPDGEWLVFASHREGPNFDVYVMKADGSDVRRLTDDLAKDSEPVWAPR